MTLSILAYINWNISPELFVIRIGSFELPITWYGILFALGFLVGQQILQYIFAQDGKSVKHVDSLTIYLIISIIVGARLGHYLFYEWELLISDPLRWALDMILPPFAGLASHGATVAMLIGIYLYSRTRPDQPFLYVTDRLVIPIAFGGAMIRLGNIFNSEIYGAPTDLPWGFRFLRETDPALLPVVPRHPTGIYEGLFCLLLMGFCFYLWKHKRHSLNNGFITGVFMILLFTSRILIEFLKNNQSDFENSLPLNMGQLLSIPMVLVGFAVLIYSLRHKRIDHTKNNSDHVIIEDRNT